MKRQFRPLEVQRLRNDSEQTRFLEQFLERTKRLESKAQALKAQPPASKTEAEVDVLVAHAGACHAALSALWSEVTNQGKWSEKSIKRFDELRRHVNNLNRSVKKTGIQI